MDKCMKNINMLSELTKFLKPSQSNPEQGVRQLPPVHLWHPNEHIEMDLCIKANGEWWHEGSKITRERLVTLFASILVVENEPVDAKSLQQNASTYYLKTPVQKALIQVEDAPLLVNQVAVVPIVSITPMVSTTMVSITPMQDAQKDTSTPYWIELTTTTEDVIRLDAQHLPYFKRFADDMRLYIHVRSGLHALIGRNAYYHLLELGDISEQDGTMFFSFTSGGVTHHIEYPES